MSRAGGLALAQDLPLSVSWGAGGRSLDLAEQDPGAQGPALTGKGGCLRSGCSLATQEVSGALRGAVLGPALIAEMRAEVPAQRWQPPRVLSMRQALASLGRLPPSSHAWITICLLEPKSPSIRVVL